MTYNINGINGNYNSTKYNQSIKYGLNSANNYKNEMLAPVINIDNNVPPIFKFSNDPAVIDDNLAKMKAYADKNDEYLNSLPPLEFEYRYAPLNSSGLIDKKAALAAALEEMDGNKELSVDEFEYRYLIDENQQTAKPLDVNNDGKIDIAEYASNMIASDILSKGTTDPLKADGVINNKGIETILTYTKKSNADAAAKLYSNIYNTHNLGSELNEFSL